LFPVPNSKSVKQINDKDTQGLLRDNHDPAQINLGYIAEKISRLTKSWVLWSVLLTIIPSGIGLIAMSMLLKLPSAPNCPEIFWPLASASVRLHCAQIAAAKQTVNDLLQAIALVKQLPPDHPLKRQIDGFLQQWSRDILQLADQSFQSGKLEVAIATAQKIPPDLAERKIAEDQIDQWRSIWSKAEDIYHQSEDELRQRHWQSAFMVSSRLLRSRNKFWATTKYEQLNQIIVSAREDGDKLYKAESLVDSGTVDNILAAIKIADSIKEQSYLHQKAQELIPVFARKMLKLAQNAMDRRDAETALGIVRRIPPIGGLQSEVDDFIVLGEAQRSAWIGTVPGLTAAISQAQQIDPSREVYEKAQKLIARWQLEIEDVSHLEKARSLASQGTINDLEAAISEVALIPSSNPRAQEAEKEVNHWHGQVESIEDQPLLDRADQMALLEDVNSLEAAIAQANQIRAGRSLYGEARRKIRSWTAKIQRIQDQPLLDQARSLAETGNYTAAISAAQNLAASRRALARDAQNSIDTWREQIHAKENWENAKNLAAVGTPSALSQAIRLADKVSTRNVLRMDANVAIDQWSQELLQMARSQGESDISKGINIAQLVPRGTSAYRDAQDQIRTWRQFLRPQLVPSPQNSPLSQINNGLSEQQQGD
jgi:hypothetical protein